VNGLFVMLNGVNVERKFKAGDTITNGLIYLTIIRVTRSSYQLKLEGDGDAYMPIALVDKFWELASNEGEIVDD